MNLISKAYAANDWDILKPTAAGANYSWQTLVNNVLTIILAVAGALAVIYLIYSGILYITAAGNPDSAKKGQQGIINAVIGIVIIVAAYFIMRIAVGLGQEAIK